MNASEFYQLSNDLGKKYIESLGFKSNAKGDWYYVGKDYMLAFVLQNHNSSQHFDVKYITLIFNSYIKTKDIAPMKPMKHADGPMKINPLKLKSYIESNFDDKEWHYINDGKGFSNSHCPIYYGGVKKKAFTSIFSKAVPNRVTVPEFITNRGVEIVSEKEAYKQFEKCFKSVAVYGFKWAEHLTFDEILRQLQKYGENWFVVNQWIEAYETNNKYKI